MLFTRLEVPRPKANGKDPEAALPVPGPDGRGVDDESIDLTPAIDQVAIAPAENGSAQKPELIGIEKEALSDEPTQEEVEPDLLSRIDRALADERRSQNEAVNQTYINLDLDGRMKIARTEQLQSVLFMRSAAKRKDVVLNKTLELVSDRLQTVAAGSGKQIIDLKKAQTAHHADETAYREMLDDKYVSEETKEAIRRKLDGARSGIEAQIIDQEGILKTELGSYPLQIEKLNQDSGKQLNLFRGLLAEASTEERLFRDDIKKIEKDILASQNLKMAETEQGDLRDELQKALREGKKRAEKLLKAISSRREQLAKRVEVTQKRYNELFRMHSAMSAMGKTEAELAADQVKPEGPSDETPSINGIATPLEPSDISRGEPAAVESVPVDNTSSMSGNGQTEMPVRGAADGYDEDSDRSVPDDGTDIPVRPEEAQEGSFENVSAGEILDQDALDNEEKARKAKAAGGERKNEESLNADWELFKARIAPSTDEMAQMQEENGAEIWEMMDAETRKVFIRTIEDVPKAERPLFKKTVESIWKDKRTFSADRISDTLKELYKRQLNDKHPENNWALRRALTAPDTNTYRGDRQLRLADVVGELLRFLPEMVNRGTKVNYWRMLDKLAKIKF